MKRNGCKFKEIRVIIVSLREKGSQRGDNADNDGNYRSHGNNAFTQSYAQTYGTMRSAAVVKRGNRNRKRGKYQYESKKAG